MGGGGLYEGGGGSGGGSSGGVEVEVEWGVEVAAEMFFFVS